jgi:glycerol kinase
VIVGLTRFITRGHIARAALEATAYQTRDVVEAMIADSGIHLTELRVDGGMVQNELLMQFQADILNVPVVRPVVTETTSLGAAYAAGLAVGYWANEQEIAQYWKEAKRWNPQMGEDQRSLLYRGWKKAVERSFGWVEL